MQYAFSIEHACAQLVMRKLFRRFLHTVNSLLFQQGKTISCYCNVAGSSGFDS